MFHRRALVLASIGLALSSCADPPATDHSLGAVSGGWDYNNARWNSAVDALRVGPIAPYGELGPNTIDAYSHVVFQLRPADPVFCVDRDPAVSSVYVVGSRDEPGGAWGPRVMVQRGGSAAPLPVDESIAMAASVRTQTMTAAAAVPVVLRVHRVHDYVRPDGGWIRWPQYAVEMITSDCAARWLAVGIFGPAPALPTSPDSATALATLPGVVAFYAGYYDRTDPSLLAKAAMNLDAPLTFPWETGTSGVSCASRTPIAANQVAYLGAFATGATIVTHAPDDEQRRPILVFRTRPGAPYRAHMSVMVGGNPERVCHRSSERGRNAKLDWPSGETTELDVVHAAGLVKVSGEVAASQFTWLASGTSARRADAFVESSRNEQRLLLDSQADTAAAAVRIKTLAGALPAWSALHPLLRDRTSLVVVAQTLPSAQASSGAEWASEQAMLNPVCGDRICGIGEIEACGFDCPVGSVVPPPPDGGSDAPMLDAGWSYHDAGGMVYDAGSPIDAGSPSDAATPDAAMPDAGWSYDAGSPSDAAMPDAGWSYHDAGTAN